MALRLWFSTTVENNHLVFVQKARDLKFSSFVIRRFPGPFDAAPWFAAIAAELEANDSRFAKQ
jgi:hypothetical protein